MNGLIPKNDEDMENWMEEGPKVQVQFILSKNNSQLPIPYFGVTVASQSWDEDSASLSKRRLIS